MVISAAATTVVSLTGATLSWLLHPSQADPELGLTRVYLLMGDLANTCLIFAGAFFLSRSARGNHWVAGWLTLLLLLSALLQLTRANYLALAVAFLLGTYVFMAHYAAGGTRLVRAVVAVLILLTCAFSLSTVTGGTTAGGSVATSVVTRVQTGLTDLSQSAGTVGYRQRVDAAMVQVLGSRWPIGLGFLHPAAHYVAALPAGSIRNSDTGVFNILMTMGAIGLILLYAPFIYAIRYLLGSARRPSQPSPARPPWIVYGGVAWIGWAIAGSPTLIVLFSTSGLVLAALVLAAIARAEMPGVESQCDA